MSNKDIAIKVEDISKRYRIGLKEAIHETFGGAIIDFLKSPLNNYKKYRSLYKFDEINPKLDNNFESPDIIWALRDVSFEVKQGEVLGIIGKNGSGKSTLLKILSKITDPTSGRAKILGRVSSLLEVGTGFNQELTGRENIYLNGTILGMKKKEINQKFDEIVYFSGVEKFIDTPVKRYSSGMSVRLAFAVAAHLEPEILIVDEVLAVGDAEFQKKCLGKMGDMAKGGRTVLLVSHNMGAITDLCSRTLWLENGRVKLDGPSMDVVSKYLSLYLKGEGSWFGNTQEVCSDRRAWLKCARVVSGNGNKVSPLLQYNQPAKIEIEYEIKHSVKDFKCYVIFKDYLGNILLASHDTDGNQLLGQERKPGIYLSTCNLPERLLRPGTYYVTIGIVGKRDKTVMEERQDVMTFKISESNYAFRHDPRIGLFTPSLNWKVVHQQKNS